MWKPLSQRKEQVITSRQSETATVVQSNRRVGDSQHLPAEYKDVFLRQKIHFYKHSDHLQANANSDEGICKTKYIFSWLWTCLTGLQLTATQSISITRVMSSIQFENMDRHYRRGIPYFGQVRKGIESLYWRRLTANLITTIMGIFEGLFGAEGAHLKLLYMRCPTDNSEYWRVLVYSEFDSARNTLNKNNPLNSIFLTCILSLI